MGCFSISCFKSKVSSTSRPRDVSVVSRRLGSFSLKTSLSSLLNSDRSRRIIPGDSLSDSAIDPVDTPSKSSIPELVESQSTHVLNSTLPQPQFTDSFYPVNLGFSLQDISEDTLNDQIISDLTSTDPRFELSKIQDSESIPRKTFPRRDIREQNRYSFRSDTSSNFPRISPTLSPLILSLNTPEQEVEVVEQSPKSSEIKVIVSSDCKTSSEDLICNCPEPSSHSRNSELTTHERSIVASTMDVFRSPRLQDVIKPINSITPSERKDWPRKIEIHKLDLHHHLRQLLDISEGSGESTTTTDSEIEFRYKVLTEYKPKVNATDELELETGNTVIVWRIFEDGWGE
ncbi:hypothetical protein HK096_003620, partial [Nowakowskiella sp. JEL0078]